MKRDQATRDGDRVLSILTHLPLRKASAKRVARLYRKRWILETAFQHLEAYFHSAINTLGYPKAALFGFCLALVAYNMLAVVMAALRSVHGANTIEQCSYNHASIHQHGRPNRLNLGHRQRLSNPQVPRPSNAGRGCKSDCGSIVTTLPSGRRTITLTC